MLPGDGVGPEIVGAALDMLREADRIFELGLTFETAAIGFDSLRTAGTPSRTVVWVRPRDDLSTKGRRVLLVSRVRHLFGLQWTSLVGVAISLRICPAPLGALSSHETTSCQAAGAAADLHQRSKICTS